MSIESLAELALEKIRTTRIGKKCLEESSEIVVFGSRSVGLEREDSDIDILCIGSMSFKLKTNELDLNAIQARQTNERLWLNSELASHIAEYGIWIKGSPTWVNRVEIGLAAVESKRRRVAAFMNALPGKWQGLDEGFREKYSIKLRREAQRLLLLERGTPIPPTRMLDSFWATFKTSPHEVQDCLRRFANSCPTAFEEDLLARISAAINAQGGANISGDLRGGDTEPISAPRQPRS